MTKKYFERKINGREEISLSVEVDESQKVLSSELTALGPLPFLRQVNEWRNKFVGPLSSVTMPEGDDTGSMLLREILLKAKGEWNPPYQQEQMCHCRAISTTKVEEAILVGNHSHRKVSRMTSASTACGTCHPDVQAMIDYWKKPDA